MENIFTPPFWFLMFYFFTVKKKNFSEVQNRKSINISRSRHYLKIILCRDFIFELIYFYANDVALDEVETKSCLPIIEGYMIRALLQETRSVIY